MFDTAPLEIVSAFGWALLTSVWSIALVTAFTCAVLAVSRRLSPSVRYRLAAAGLLLASAVFVAGFLEQLSSVAPTVVVRSALSELGPVATDAVAVDPLKETLSWSFDALLLACLWMLGFSFAIARLVIAYRGVSHLRQTSIPLLEPRRQQIQQLARESGWLGPVDIRMSPGASTPLVIGIRRPLILVPRGFFELLEPTQVEALLRHEIAHVARRDLLVGIAQAILKSIFFFHPGVHILSRIMDVEREKACDLMAGTAPERRRALASGLAVIATTSTLRPRLGTVGASGSPGAILERLEHLTASDDNGSLIIRRTRWLQHNSAMLIAIGIIGVGVAATAREISGSAEQGWTASNEQLLSGPIMPSRMLSDRNVPEDQALDIRQTAPANLALIVLETDAPASGANEHVEARATPSLPRAPDAPYQNSSERADEEKERRFEAMEREDEKNERPDELAEQRFEFAERSIEMTPRPGEPPPVR